MTQSSEITKISKADLDFIKEELSKQNTVPTLTGLTEILAYKKNAKQLNQEVLKYNPSCNYEVNDLICKEYDEPLIINSKEKIHFTGKVVLKVMNIISYPDYNCEMLEVDYTGGGIFRKHIDYMKRKNTQVLLPAAIENQAETPEVIKKEDDPRLHKLPMTEKDMKTLMTNLKKSISTSDEFFGWNEHWQLVKKKIKIPDSTIKIIEKYFKEKKQPASSKLLIERFFNIKPEDNKFDLYCLSLNYILNKKYKKTFICVSPENWGKWFHKEILNSFLEDKPLSADKAELPDLEETQYEPIYTKANKFPVKIYLSWREILSGGINMPSEFKKELSDIREYTFTDEEDGTESTAFYYPSHNIFLGLDEFYKKHNIPQGASLTLKKINSNHMSLHLKKSKKKLSLPYLEYNPKMDVFSFSEKEILTYALPNKIIFIENETLQNLLKLLEQRKNKDLRELLIIVFKNFGFEGKRQTLHYRKAFHLVDLIKHTSLDDVEKTLSLSPEFAISEKNNGLFFYQEKIKTEKELEQEEPLEMVETTKAEEEITDNQEDNLPEIGTVGEISTPEVHLEEKKHIRPPQETKTVEKKEKKKPKPPPSEEEIAVEEILPEKKQRKIEKKEIDFEKALRSKRGRKKIIEEQIEQEESELEAFFAVKTDDEKELEEENIEHLKSESKEKKKSKKSEKEPLTAGLFSEKLKTALNKKKNKPPSKKKK